MRALVAALTIALAGCAAPPPAEVVEAPDYDLFVPSGLDGPAPLLLMLHGGGGNPDTIREKTDMDRWAEAFGFLVAYPAGTESVNDQRTWNAAHCCGKADRDKVDHIGELLALIEDVQGRYEISRVGVAGHSNGAMMAHVMAAEAPDVIDFFASVAGSIGGSANPLRPEESAQPRAAVEAVLIHARDDPNVRFDGGRGGGLDPLRDDRPFAESVAAWTAINGDGFVDSYEDGVVQTERFAGAADTLVVTTEGGHGWPGGQPLSVIHELLVDTPATPDASAIIASAFVD